MKAKNLFLTDRHLQDLNPLTAGEQVCDPGHSFGPAVRNYTLIHFVLSGRGSFRARGTVYPVEAGQAFLILPGEMTTYTADRDDPWHYCWIGFEGSLSHRFGQLPAVFAFPPDFSPAAIASLSGAAEYRLAGMLLQLYGTFFADAGVHNPHVRRVENYIRASYMQPIRVEQIAGALNLDRRYLSRLFREKTGQSIQQYLIRVRLEAAAEHLRRGSSVQEAARLSGYEDVSNFSKMFKRRYGIPPAALRKE